MPLNDKVNLLLAALEPKQAEKVDSWLKTKPRDVSFSDHVFGDKDRITEPFTPPERTPMIPNAVKLHLQKHGYHVSDHAKGLAKDKYDRENKIGRILNKTNASQSLSNRFVRHMAKKGSKDNSNLAVTYTRNPYDVAGMSTNRGWSSCLSFGGAYAEQLPKEIEHGTHVAYLHHKDDTDLHHPIARIALKPYRTKDGKDTVLYPEKIYGNHQSHFGNQVLKWANKNFKPKKGIPYKKDSRVYDDDGPSYRVLMTKKLAHNLLEDKHGYNPQLSQHAVSHLARYDLDSLQKHLKRSDVAEAYSKVEPDFNKAQRAEKLHPHNPLVSSNLIKRGPKEYLDKKLSKSFRRISALKGLDSKSNYDLKNIIDRGYPDHIEKIAEAHPYHFFKKLPKEHQEKILNDEVKKAKDPNNADYANSVRFLIGKDTKYIDQLLPDHYDENNDKNKSLHGVVSDSGSHDARNKILDNLEKAKANSVHAQSLKYNVLDHGNEDHAKRLANDPDSNIRRYIARDHPKLARHFVNDSNEIIRKIAQEHLKRAPFRL